MLCTDFNKTVSKPGPLPSATKCASICARTTHATPPSASYCQYTYKRHILTQKMCCAALKDYSTGLLALS
jgi:hypothetical protein